ncbi:MAG: hypothetical protein WCS11_07440 [Dysgonamonadaceae bacterium]
MESNSHLDNSTAAARLYRVVLPYSRTTPKFNRFIIIRPKLVIIDI